MRLGSVHEEEQLSILPVSARAARRGVKRATIAVAHALLGIAYQVLKHAVEYRDLGADYFDRLNPTRLCRRLVKRLETLGFQVTLAAAQT